MKPSLRQFSIFVATAETGSLSNASKQLFVSQAAASMALKSMEDALGQALFDRVGKRLEITDYGRWMLPRAKRLLDLVREVDAGPRGELRGPLTIGSSQTIANHVLAPFHSRLLQRHPQVRLHLEVGNSRMVCEQLLAHRLDLAVVEANPHLPGLEFSPWLEDELVLVAAPDHPLVTTGGLSQQALLSAAWLLREAGSGTRSVLERALGPAFAEISIAHQVDHPATLLRLCADGQGIACVSRRTASQGFKAGWLKAVPTYLDLKRQFYCVTRKNETPSQLVKAYLEVLNEVRDQG